MKQALKYNGLKNHLNTFAKFVFIYEERIKYCNSMQDFNSISSSALSFFASQMQYKMKYATKEEIRGVNDYTKYSLYFTKSKVQILDFCRHMRNSFSHGILKKTGSTLEITDKTNRGNSKFNQNGPTYTSLGTLDFELVKNFVITIIKDYET